MQTITKLYESYDDAATTVGDLERAGMPYAHISLIANDADNRYTQTRAAADVQSHAARDASACATAGAIIGGGAGLLAGLGALAIPGIGPVVAAGWLTATLTGAVAGGVAGAAAGGLIGALTDSGMSREHAEVYAEGVRRGGAVVAVRTDDRWVSVARDIMSRRPSVDPDFRHATVDDDAWRAFDDAARTQPATEIETGRGVRRL